MREQWRPIRGYEDLYSVSNLGRIRRDAGGRGSTAGRILTWKKSPKNYLYVDLSCNDVKRRHAIHRVVATAFIGSPPSRKHVINHKDGDKHNNRVGNLEWCTQRQNNRHAQRLGLMRYKPLRGTANGRSKLTDDQVLVIRKLKGVVGQRELAILTGMARTLIQRIHQGKAWPHLIPSKDKPGRKPM